MIFLFLFLLLSNQPTKATSPPLVARVRILVVSQQPPPKGIIKRASRLFRPLSPPLRLIKGEMIVANFSLQSPTQTLSEAALFLKTLPPEDLNLVFTPPLPSLAGLALTLGTVCSDLGTNVALIALHTPQVVAHEVGHLLGMQHDATTPPWGGQCGRGLMGGLPSGWSNCSQLWWQRKLASKQGAGCLFH